MAVVVFQSVDTRNSSSNKKTFSFIFIPSSVRMPTGFTEEIISENSVSSMLLYVSLLSLPLHQMALLLD